MSLRPCLSCTRHVRNSETACPFCGANLPASSAPVPRSVVGLGRAAIMAFGMTAAACDPTTTTDAGTDAYIGGQDAAYGGPPVDAATPADDASASADAPNSPDSGNDAGGSVAAYGAPPEDAGNQSDTGGGIGPLYGGAP